MCVGVCGGARVSDTLQLSVCVYPSYAYSPPRRHVWGCGGVRAWVTLCNLVCVCLPHMPTVHQEGIPLKSSVCVCILHMPTVHQEGMCGGVWVCARAFPLQLSVCVCVCVFLICLQSTRKACVGVCGCARAIPLQLSVCMCLPHMPTVHQEGMSWGVKCADEGAPMLHLSYHDGMVCFSHVQVRIRYVNLRWVVIKRKMSKGICYVNLHWLLD